MLRREQIKNLKRIYPAGTRIELGYMEGEPNYENGMQGTVNWVDDRGQIHMNWDNGGMLALNIEHDIFKKIRAEI
jgi:hypothetical protein